MERAQEKLNLLPQIVELSQSRALGKVCKNSVVTGHCKVLNDCRITLIIILMGWMERKNNCPYCRWKVSTRLDLKKHYNSLREKEMRRYEDTQSKLSVLSKICVLALHFCGENVHRIKVLQSMTVHGFCFESIYLLSKAISACQTSSATFHNATSTKCWKPIAPGPTRHSEARVGSNCAF